MARPEQQWHLASSLGSRIHVQFQDYMGFNLLLVDSNDKNIPGLLTHTVSVIIAKSGAVTFREVLCDKRTNRHGLSLVGTLKLGRDAFAVDRVGNEDASWRTRRAFCLDLTLHSASTVDLISFDIPRSFDSSLGRLDLQGGLPRHATFKMIKFRFEGSWRDGQLREITSVLGEQHPPQPSSTNGQLRELTSHLGTRRPLQPSADDSTGRLSRSPRSTTRSTRQASVIPVKTERRSPRPSGPEETSRIHELEQQVRKQAAETEKTNKRMQDLEDLIGTSTGIKSKEHLADNAALGVELAIARESNKATTQELKPGCLHHV